MMPREPPYLGGRWLLGEDQLRRADQVVVSPGQDLGRFLGRQAPGTAQRSCRGSAPRGLSDCGAAAQPYREAVVGVLECDIDVELIDDP